MAALTPIQHPRIVVAQKLPGDGVASQMRIDGPEQGKVRCAGSRPEDVGATGGEMGLPYNTDESYYSVQGVTLDGTNIVQRIGGEPRVERGSVCMKPPTQPQCPM